MPGMETDWVGRLSSFWQKPGAAMPVGQVMMVAVELADSVVVVGGCWIAGEEEEVDSAA